LIRSLYIRPCVCLLAAVVLLGAGCAYYNTFYNAQAAYREGVKLKEQNQNSQAKAKFDKAIEKSALVIKRWPKSRWVDDALYLVGASYYQEGQYDRAVRAFDQLSLAFPNSGFVPRGELYRGLALLAGKQYGTARVTLEAVKQKYPRLADEAAYNLARSFIDRKDLERGTDSLAAFLGRFPKSRFRLPAVKLLADGSFSLRRFAEAERWYRTFAGLTDDPKPRAFANLKIAACRYEQGRNEEAIAQVGEVLGRYSDMDDESNLLLGKALTATGRHADALAAWSKVKGASDLGAESAFRIGKHYEEEAEFAKARAYYDTARIRRVDSDYGVLAVKRLALLDALAARTTGKKTGGDSLQPAEAMFLVAEVNNLNLGDYDKAMDLYQKVHDSFPETDWAAKALFAKAWLLRNVKNDTAGAEPLLRQEISEYPETEYADESRRWLGLPVPKREKKKTEAKPETTAAVPPPPARETAEVPSVEPPPVLPEVPTGDTGEAAISREPGKLHRDRRGPGWPDRPDIAGTPPGRGEIPVEQPGAPAQEKADKPAAGHSIAGETLPGQSRPPLEGSGASGAQGRGDTVPGEQTAPAGVDAGRQSGPATALRQEPVHFATDSWQIQAADSARLLGLAESLKVHLEVNLLVVGHCDQRASERYNERLGMQRAQAVRDFLVAAGVDPVRIVVRSDGEKRPVSAKPEEFWLNRRVEFEFR
jgi:outer membrane protein OmpA-like peptidoglycan-associated protein/TolA-binding protein